MRIRISGVFDKHGFQLEDKVNEEEENEQEEDIGGLFRLVTSDQKRINEEKEKMNMDETSLFSTWDQEPRDWLDEEVYLSIFFSFLIADYIMYYITE